MIKLSTIKAWCELADKEKSVVVGSKETSQLEKELRDDCIGLWCCIIYWTWRELKPELKLLEHALLIITTAGFEVDYEA